MLTVLHALELPALVLLLVAIWISKEQGVGIPPVFQILKAEQHIVWGPETTKAEAARQFKIRFEHDSVVAILDAAPVLDR